MTRNSAPGFMHHLWWARDMNVLYCYPSATAPPRIKAQPPPVVHLTLKVCGQPECQGQACLLRLPRNLWTNVTTSKMTALSKCLLNKDVLPCTLSRGAKIRDGIWLGTVSCCNILFLYPNAKAFIFLLNTIKSGIFCSFVFSVFHQYV